MNLALDYRPAADQAPLDTPPYDRWRTLDGEVAAEFRRVPGGFLVRFCDNADFVLDLAAGRVTCTPVPGNSEEFVADLFFNQILPLVMSHGGDLVLHASAVDLGGAAAGFVGATGRGKSTLAGSFARSGHAFLTDDGLILDRRDASYAVRPRRPILRLRPDSEAMLRGADPVGEDAWGDKAQVAASAQIPFSERAIPLGALYVLEETRDPPRPEIVPLTGAHALDALLRHSFMLDIEDRPWVRRHFDRIAALAMQQPCFSLDYPRDYSRLPETRAAIVGHFTQLGGIS